MRTRARNTMFRETEAQRVARFAAMARRAPDADVETAGPPDATAGDARREGSAGAKRPTSRKASASGAVTPLEPTHVIFPRPHQEAARDAILAARAAGAAGHLLGDETGVGKTLGAWLAVAAMAEASVLVVAPPGALPQWRRTILGSGRPRRRKVFKLTTYDMLGKLLGETKRTEASLDKWRRDQAHKAPFLQRWEIVIFDESHRMKNAASQRAIIGTRLARQAAFCVFVSATAGEVPRHLHYMAHLLERACGLTPGGRSVPAILKAIGLEDGAPEAEERAAIARLLFTGAHPIGLRRRAQDISGWPSVRRELAPVALDAASRGIYDEAWGQLVAEIEAIAGDASGAASAGDRARARMRSGSTTMVFRQKASLLRARGTAAFVADLVENGLQVFVSTFFIEAGDLIAKALEDDGIAVARIRSKSSRAENERQRMVFQSGLAKVVVTSVSDSITLHQGEETGGEAPRACVVHDQRLSAIDVRQVEGRINRNGVGGVVYYGYAEDTVEEDMVERIVARMAAMDGMAGDDTSLIDAMADAIEARRRTKGSGQRRQG